MVALRMCHLLGVAIETGERTVAPPYATETVPVGERETRKQSSPN